MHILRLVFIFLFLLQGSTNSYAQSSGIISAFETEEIKSQISEDFQTSSPSHLSVTTDFYKDRITLTPPAVLVGEDFRINSREIAYLSFNRFIEPGLTLPDIIFPFHTFL